MPKILKLILILCVVGAGIGLVLIGLGTWGLLFKSNQVSVTTVPVSEKTDLYSIEGEYPQFPTAPAELNKEISDYVSGQIADFKKTAQENWQARQDTLPPAERQAAPDSPFDFVLNWSHGQINQQSVSIVLHIGAYEGGANASEDVKTFTYDLQKKRDLTLRDFFSQPDYLNRLSATARAQLTDHLREAEQAEPDADMINSGTTPSEDNFSNFTVDGDYMTIYFPKYQVAPGAAGEQTITIKISEL